MRPGTYYVPVALSRGRCTHFRMFRRIQRNVLVNPRSIKGAWAPMRSRLFGGFCVSMSMAITCSLPVCKVSFYCTKAFSSLRVLFPRLGQYWKSRQCSWPSNHVHESSRASRSFQHSGPAVRKWPHAQLAMHIPVPSRVASSQLLIVDADLQTRWKRVRREDQRQNKHERGGFLAHARAVQTLMWDRGGGGAMLSCDAENIGQ